MKKALITGITGQDQFCGRDYTDYLSGIFPDESVGIERIY